MRKVLGKDGVNRLAEKEHGRWNVERLLLGWTYAPEKNIERKESPYLVPWDRIPLDVQQFDITAIEELPKVFRELGEDVYRLSDSPDKRTELH